eukprot:jgi/Tetstr1/422782/TSEL_013579.t1
MEDDDPPSEVDRPAKSVDPAPHPEPASPAAVYVPTATREASEVTVLLEHTSATSTPAQASCMAQLAAEAHRVRRPPRRTIPLQPPLAEAIAATISQRINTPPEPQHEQWLTDTMTVAGVEMYHYHTEPTLLRMGDDNLCAISLGQDDEEFADTLRLAVALTSPVALLRAIRLRTIGIYLTESEFDPSELLIHPVSQTIREAGELGGNTGHNQIRRAAIGLRKKALKTAPASLALRATGRPIYALTLQLTAHHHTIIGGTRSTNKTEQWRKTVSTAPPSPCAYNHSPTATAMPGAQADDDEELELNYEENNSAI